MNQPTGIIRTLPTLYGDGTVGAEAYRRSLDALDRGLLPAIYIALSSVPRVDVLHIYLLIGGKIDVRLNVAGYEPGDAARCWDDTIRTPKFWAVCTGPVSRSPSPIERRGFQGFRYTGDLW